MSDHDHAPAWLFSFVDLAFLLLIAMTQIGVDAGGISLELGEVVVPRIHTGETLELPTGAERRWQLRVHPTDDTRSSPFELALPGGESPAVGVRLEPEALRQQLAALHAEGARKPMLAPHADSRSQDMLDAAGYLEEQWPTRRRATVAPVLPGR
jgi:hypothetical protein